MVIFRMRYFKGFTFLESLDSIKMIVYYIGVLLKTVVVFLLVCLKNLLPCGCLSLNKQRGWTLTFYPYLSFYSPYLLLLTAGVKSQSH